MCVIPYYYYFSVNITNYRAAAVFFFSNFFVENDISLYVG